MDAKITDLPRSPGTGEDLYQGRSHTGEYRFGSKRRMEDTPEMITL